jgi:predicted transcriptional regulator
LWLAWFGLFILWIGLATVGYFAWRRVSTDLYHCWNQVGDEDGYIAKQEKRIDDLIVKLERMQIQMEQDYAMLSDRVESTSNEVSMTHDYASGLHYSLVEHGGFLRNGCGLSQAQWVHLTTLERANLVTARTLGSVEYMRLVRQRFTPQGVSEAMEEDATMEISAGTDSVTDIMEFLKTEHLKCLEKGDLWDANEIQNTILSFLEEIRTENTSTMLARCKERVATVFEEMWKKRQIKTDGKLPITIRQCQTCTEMDDFL